MDKKLGTKRGVCKLCEKHINTVQYDTTQVSHKTHPQRQEEDLLSTSHNAPVVQDMTQLLDCAGVERCEFTLERLHV